MKMKNWTRSAGFTLVELIVVIAILGILSAGAAVGYSGYVKKANKAADEALVAQVKYALELAAINGDITEGGGVVLKVDASPVIKDVNGKTSSDEGSSAVQLKEIEDALNAAFGDYTTLKLVYDGWKSSDASKVSQAYRDSVFDGNEGALLGDIQTLTTAMAGVFQNDIAAESVAGGSFNAYLQDKGISISGNPQEAANYATLFVASQIAGLTDTQKAAINKVWNENTFYYGGNPSDVLSGVKKYADEETGLSTLGAMAVYYANLEAMVKYVNTEASKPESEANADELARFNAAFDSIKTSFAGSTNVESVWQTMASGYSAMVDATTAGSKIQELITGYGSAAKNADTANRDANAFLAAMGAMDQASEMIGDNIADTNLYGSGRVEQALKGYLDLGTLLGGTDTGVIGVVITVDSDNAFNTWAYPIDYSK